MPTETHEFETTVVWLPVNQNEIGPDMTIAVIAPIARKRVIKIASRQHRVRSQNRDGFRQNDIKFFPC